MLDPFIGDLLLSRVYMETLRPFIEKRNKDGVKTKTINLSLGTVRRILRLAADEWRDKQGATWLQMAPKIKLFRITNARKPHSLSVEEQQFLFNQLPSHLLRMALYKANTGSRQEEVCSLRWEWEKQMPEIGTSVFVIPGEKVKNTEERLVVLNRIARSVIEDARGMHPAYVFVRRSEDGLTVPVKKMNNSASRRITRTPSFQISSQPRRKHAAKEVTQSCPDLLAIFQQTAGCVGGNSMLTI